MQPQFKGSRLIDSIGHAELDELLSTVYAVMLFQQGEPELPGGDRGVNASVKCSFPVWIASDRQSMPIARQFQRNFGGEPTYFFPASEEIVGLSFTNSLREESVFVRLKRDPSTNAVKIRSIVCVDAELFIGLELAARDGGKYPRILFAHGSGKAGLLLTKQPASVGKERDHFVVYLPELCLGVPIDMHRRKLSLHEFMMINQ